MSRKYIPVSVVIPCYRCSETIERTLSSVAAQTFLPQEVICIEDCSNDANRTFDKLIWLQDKYGSDWIKIIRHEANKKAGYARNSGWNNAIGKYIAFLDGDDTWHPRKMEIQYEIMEKSPHIHLSGNSICLLSSRQTPPALDLPAKIKKIGRMRILMHNPFFTSSIMCKRSISLRFEKLANCEDYQLWMNMFFHSYSLVLISPTLSYMHKPPYGVTGLGSSIWKAYRALNQIFLLERQKKNITLFEYILIKIYWDAKQLRRIIISYYYYISYRFKS